MSALGRGSPSLSNFKAALSGRIRYTVKVADLGDTCHESEAVDVAGLNWKLHVGCRLGKNAQQDHLKVYLSCSENGPCNLWMAKVSLEFNLLHPDDSMPLINYTSRHDEFTSKASVWGKHEFAPWQPMHDQGYVLENGSITVEAKFTVKEVHGVRKRPRMDFTQTEEGVTDAVLVVEGTRVHVNKGVLAIHSAFFKSMFFSNFRERNQEEIKIEEVNVKDFTDFLHLCYPSENVVNGDNVETLLDLADRFSAQAVTDKCEDWLRNTSDVQTKKKVAIADKYNLPLLKVAAISAITSRAEMQKLRNSDDFAAFSLDTRSLLLDRALQLCP